MSALKMKACGKINLFLSVVGKRPDGYHEIETLFLPVPEIADELTFSPADSDSLRSDAPIPLNADNLCMKALVRYREAVREKGGVLGHYAIELDKRIPVAGGMGGGSSDAACVLRFLQTQTQNALSEAELAGLALNLGADVPFFLQSEPAAATGIGEELTRLSAPIPFELPLIIVTFDFPIAAAWAYRAYDRACGADGFSARGKAAAFSHFLRHGSREDLEMWMMNDLSPALFEKFPLLGLVRNLLHECTCNAIEISGSGPTLFALAPDMSRARAAAALVNKAFAGRLHAFAVRAGTPAAE